MPIQSVIGVHNTTLSRDLHPSFSKTLVTPMPMDAIWPTPKTPVKQPDPWENKKEGPSTEHRPDSSTRKSKQNHRRFQVLQQWEGIIVSIDGQEFEARLHDLTKPSNSEEIATFSLKEISQADRALVAPGAVFYWTIGYEMREGGQITNVSEIRCRRTPPWSEQELKTIKEKASKLYQQLTTHANPTALTGDSPEA
jgi:hypothetical protein